MIRNLNYTGRRRISRSAAEISLVDGREGKRYFDVALKLEGLGLPETAAVVLEAYYKVAYKRFELGSVGAILIPPEEERDLAALEVNDVVHFRLKIVDRATDAGVLLAEADGIEASGSRKGNGRRLSLLPVDARDLGSTIWQLSFESGKPVLQVNNRIPNVKDLFRQHPMFISLTYPPIVREVLTQIVLIDSYRDATENSSDWHVLWLRFIRGFFGEPPPSPTNPEEEDSDEYKAELAEWVNNSVARFCEKHSILERNLSALNGEGSHE